MKMDGLTWPKMFIAFIFANDLTETPIAGEYGFIPHGFNNSDVTADRNITFGRPGSIRKLHMFRPEAEMNSPAL